MLDFLVITSTRWRLVGPKNFYFRYNGIFSHFLFEVLNLNFSLSAHAYAYQTHIRTKLPFYNSETQNVPTNGGAVLLFIPYLWISKIIFGYPKIMNYGYPKIDFWIS